MAKIDKATQDTIQGEYRDMVLKLMRAETSTAEVACAMLREIVLAEAQLSLEEHFESIGGSFTIETVDGEE